MAARSWRGAVRWGARALVLLSLAPWIGWGVALGAWLATAAAVVSGLVVLLGRGRAVALAVVPLAAMLCAGPPEVAWRITELGARARHGELSPRDRVAAFGVNAGLGAVTWAAGLPSFAQETWLLAAPWSLAGPCPDDRLRAYGRHLPRAYPGHTPRLRRWRSDLPLRSPKIRAVVRGWAAALPERARGERDLGSAGPFVWPSSAYFAPTESADAVAALNTPTTRLSGRAVAEGGRWRLDLAVDLAVAYPERATLQAGPFALEEGLFHDARPLLQPYCAEYVWQTWADDPALQGTAPVRGLRERALQAALRAAGAGYR